MEATESWGAACLYEDADQPAAAEAGNVEFPMDFKGFRITVIFRRFLRNGPGPDGALAGPGFPMISNRFPEESGVPSWRPSEACSSGVRGGTGNDRFSKGFEGF